MATPFPEQLRETIRSRCWLISFQPLAIDDIKNILINYYNVEKSLARSVAPFSNGSVAEAVNLLRHDMEMLKEKTILILRYSLGRKYHSALEEFNSVVEGQGGDIYKILVLMMISWFNDLQKFRAGLDDFFFEDHKDTFKKFNLRFSDVKLNEIVYKLDRLSSLIKQNINLNTLSLNIITELSLLTQR